MSTIKVHEHVFHTKTRKEQQRLGSYIHEQLQGSEDYRLSRIVLDCTNENNRVHLVIFYDCVDWPYVETFKNCSGMVSLHVRCETSADRDKIFS